MSQSYSGQPLFTVYRSHGLFPLVYYLYFLPIFQRMRRALTSPSNPHLHTPITPVVYVSRAKSPVCQVAST